MVGRMNTGFDRFVEFRLADVEKQVEGSFYKYCFQIRNLSSVV